MIKLYKRTVKMKTEYIILIITCAVLFLAALTTVTSYICYRITFVRKSCGPIDPYKALDTNGIKPYRDEAIRLINELSAIPCEEIRIKSYDGLALYGRYYKGADGAPLEIQMHGYRSSAIRDFSGGTLASLRKGRHVILVDQRAHGYSEGKALSFGINERRDADTWVKYAAERFGEKTPIVLVGLSMGAATVIMAGGNGLSDNVACIVADCPYSSPKEIIMRVCRHMGYPARLVFPFIRLGGILFGKFDITESSPVEAAGKIKIPTVLIHGEADKFVPSSMSERIYESLGCPDKLLVLFPDAAHGVSFLSDYEKYRNTVDPFVLSAIESYKKKTEI